MKALWEDIEQGVEKNTRIYVNKISATFSVAIQELSKANQKFLDNLLYLLMKKGETNINTAVGMGLIGAYLGYNKIPSYFSNKIAVSRMSQSSKPRPEIYSTYRTR